MKKGKWNYTQDITYQVVSVRLLPVPETPLHWQNAFAGMVRQAVLITDTKGHRFLIDNEDGTGLLKIQKGGGPDSYSAHIGQHDPIDFVPEEEWIQFDRALHLHYRELCDTWQEANYPEEFKRLQDMRDHFKSLR